MPPQIFASSARAPAAIRAAASKIHPICTMRMFSSVPAYPGDLEQFQEKWEPVFCPELRQDKDLEDKTRI